jgi:thiamine biosynthesis lipoprotein
MNNNGVLVILTFVCLTSGCKEKKSEFSNIVGSAQGTTYSIIFEKDPDYKYEVIQREVEKIFHDFDLSLSIYTDSSVISKINRNEDVIVDTYFSEVFKKSRDISIMTDGAFDITVGPLVRAWGFGPDEHKNFDSTKLDSLMKLIGYEKVALRNERLIKSNPGISLDVNAIAGLFRRCYIPVSGRQRNKELPD